VSILRITAKEWDEALGPKGAAQPGDTVDLQPGEYTGRHFPILRSGAPDAPIYVTAHPGVLFDGAYTYPTGTAANTGPGGDVIYKALLQLRASHVHLNLYAAELAHSRGYGVQVSGTVANPLSNVQVNGLRLRDLRTAGIRFDYCSNFEAGHNHVTGAGNYYPAFREGSAGGWPMCINAVACSNGELHHNVVTDSWGEGVQASRGSSKVDIHHNITGHLMGFHYYVHGASDVRVFSNIAVEWGDYLRALPGQPGSPPDLVGINPGEKQYEGTQELAAHNIQIVNNLAIGGYHNLAVWAGGDAKLDNCLFAHNTAINAKAGAKGSGHGAILVRGGENVTRLRFVANMLHQLDGAYGTIARLADVTFRGNAYDGLQPAVWQTDSDLQYIALSNPDAPVTGIVVDTRNYYPATAAGLSSSTGIETDFYGNARKHYSPGAFEYMATEPPPPEPPPAERRARLISADLTETQANALKELLGNLQIEWL
jgi:hypothetical protein